MKTVLAQARCLFNLLQLNHLNLGKSEHFVANVIEEILSKIEASEPSHLEALVLINLITNGHQRGFIRSHYLHTKHTEGLIEQKNKDFMVFYKNDLEALSKKLPTNFNTSEKRHLVHLALLAHCRFEISSPIMNNLQKFLPYLNDIFLCVAYLASIRKDQIQAVNKELKKRIKTKVFSLKFINFILGNIVYRSKVVRMKVLELKKDQDPNKNFHREIIENSAEFKRPTLIEDTKAILEDMGNSLDILEAGTMELISSPKLYLAKNCIMESIGSHLVFEDNLYRKPEYPFSVNNENRVVVDLQDFIKSTQLLRSVQRSGLELCAHIRNMMIKVENKEFLSVFSWNDWNQLAALLAHSNYFEKDVWVIIEEVVGGLSLEYYEKVYRCDLQTPVHINR